MITLGIDLGTQSIKAIVYDFDKKEIVAQASESIDIINGPDGTREQKARWWIDALDKCLDTIPNEIKANISAIAVSGQQHGFVPVSSDGAVLYNVKLWCDTSTLEECKELTRLYGGQEALINDIGNPILPGYTASKILWLKKHHRDIFDKTSYVMLPHDYINYYLTGIVSMERGDASGTGLMDIRKGTWSEKLCSIIDDSLKEKLPRTIKEPGILGSILPSIASRFGLSADVQVATGGGDNMMGAIGTASVSDGCLTLSLGTSGTLFVSSSKPAIDPFGALAAFCSSHGSWLPLLCTMNCTVASESVRKFLDLDVKEFDDIARKAPVGSEGVLLLPFFNGERIPNLPNGKGTFTGLTPENMKKENIARASLEGVSFEFLLGLESFKQSSVECKTISLTGGGANSAIWREIVADMTGCSVRVPKIKESAAFGAAIQAYWLSSGKPLADIVSENVVFDEEKSVEPVMENNKIYKELYKKWCSYVDALTPLFN